MGLGILTTVKISEKIKRGEIYADREYVWTSVSLYFKQLHARGKGIKWISFCKET